MNQKVSQFVMVVVSSVFIQEVLNLRLESDKLFPLRAEKLTLSCLTSGSFNSGIIYWYNPAGSELSSCYATRGRYCEGSTNSYSYTANASGTYASIKALDRIRDGGKWKCVHKLHNVNEADTKDIVIYTSPHGVHIVQPIPPIRDLGHEPVTLKCQTDSCAFPAPIMTWYYRKDGQITQYLGSSGNMVSYTSPCTQQEAIHSNTLQLPRGTNFSGNIPFTAKFLCGVTHPSLPGEIRYSGVFNDVVFAVSMVNLIDSASMTKVFYEGFPQALSCISSPSLPVPFIRWILQTQDETTYLTDNITETDTTDSNGLHVRASDITIFAWRRLIDKKIFCAGYIDGQPAVMSNSVRIDVLYQANKPVIHQYGAEFPWFENQTGTLSCHTTDYGSPKSKVIWTVHRGTADSSGNLAITKLLPDDDGKNVVCQLANNYTVDKNISVLSQPITLNIEYSPIIEFNTSSPLTVNESNSASVLCSARGNPEPNQPSWGRRSTDSTLRFTNISRADMGKYTCEVKAKSTKHGMLTKSKEIEIFVQYAPDLRVTIIGSVRQNMTSIIACEANGIPAKYTFHPWTHKIGEVEIRSGLHGIPEGITNSNTNMLTLDKISLQDMGTYICSAENGIEGISGNVIRTGAVLLNVQGTPAVLKKHEDTFAGDIGSSINMSVPFYSHPVILNFKFQRNGSDVKNTSRTSTYLHKDTVGLMFHNTLVKLEVSTANLYIENLTKADFKDYTLVLENAIGKTEFKLQLNEPGRPCKVQKFYINRFIEDQVELYFDPGFNGGAYQTFVIQYMSLASPDNKWHNTSVTNLGETESIYKRPNGTFFVNITTLPLGSYLYRMYSWNSMGSSLFSENITLKVPCAFPVAPSNVTVADVTQNSLTVQWVAGHSGGLEQTFRVVALSGDFTRSVYEADPGYQNVGTAVVQGLSSNTRYDVYISANTTNCTSNMTQAITVYTRNDKRVYFDAEMRLSIFGVVAVCVVFIVATTAVFLKKTRRCTRGTCNKQGQESRQRNDIRIEISPIVNNPVGEVTAEYENERVNAADDNSYYEIPDVMAESSCSECCSLPEDESYEEIDLYEASQERTYSILKPNKRMKGLHMWFRSGKVSN